MKQSLLSTQEMNLEFLVGNRHSYIEDPVMASDGYHVNLHRWTVFFKAKDPHV